LGPLAGARAHTHNGREREGGREGGREIDLYRGTPHHKSLQNVTLQINIVEKSLHLGQTWDVATWRAREHVLYTAKPRDCPRHYLGPGLPRREGVIYSR